MIKYFVSIIFLSLSFSVQAQQKWTLRECINYATENNIELKQQELRIENAEIDLNTSKNSRLPDLNAKISNDFNLGVLMSDSLVRKTSMGTTFGISSSMPLFTGYKIPNQIEKNKLDLSATIEGLKKAKENLGIQVANYFLDVLFKKELLKVYKDQTSLTKMQVEKTQILFDAGKIAEAQLYDIKAQLAKDELNVTIAENDLSISRLNLVQLLNFTDFDNFDIIEPTVGDVIADNRLSLVRPNIIYEQALTSKPQIKEAEIKIESSKKALNIAKADYYPTLNLNAGYNTGFGHIFNYPNPSIGKQISNRNSQYIGLSLDIPIFNRFRTRNNVRSAQLDIENQKLSLDNVKLSLFKEIQQAYQSAIASQAKYYSTEKAKIAAEESFKYAQEKYNVGNSSVFELSEAQNKLVSSRSEQIQAKYDFLFRTKILDFYQGKDINLQ